MLYCGIINWEIPLVFNNFTKAYILALDNVGGMTYF
tara:strand:- start:217 stop:324 length:108 start_codon:yes stop_codon:yes gene_type:complete